MASSLSLLASCSAPERPPEPATTTATDGITGTTAPPAEVTVVAAGDIACRPGEPATADHCQQDATAALAESLQPDVVLALGDLQYERGEAVNFSASYDRSWGRLKAVTRPVPGNHEYAGGKAAGYFGYWGDAAHGPGGWYSFDVPEVGWHVVVLNSVCAAVGGCGDGSPQMQWLRDDLASPGATAASCTLAAWHHPRRSSGFHGDTPAMDAAWRAVASAGGDVVLSGHDHHYERFAPVDGVRQFVAGTGGRSRYPVITRQPGSEAVRTDRFGVLDLTLRRDGYAWRFVASGPTPGEVLDSGQASCR